jgi:hypothetical protein
MSAPAEQTNVRVGRPNNDRHAVGVCFRRYPEWGVESDLGRHRVPEGRQPDGLGRTVVRVCDVEMYGANVCSHAAACSEPSITPTKAPKE